MTLAIALQNHAILTDIRHSVTSNDLPQTITLAIQNGLPGTMPQQQALQAR